MAGKTGRVQFAGTTLRVLCTNWPRPVYPPDRIADSFWSVARMSRLCEKIHPHAYFLGELPRRSILLMAALAGGAVAAVIPAHGSGAAVAQDAGPSGAAVSWTTGADLAERLSTPVGVTLRGSPLREGLYRLGRTQRVAVLLDRRIDPGQELDVVLNQVPLAEALQQIADAGSMGVSQLGALFYFGPPPAAAKLRTLAAMKREELQRLPRDVALRLAQSRRWRWDDLATPRELLAALAKEGRFELEGLEQVPHDLWAGADLPPLALLDRLTLLALQFGLTFSVSPDGAIVRLVPLPAEVAVVRRYPGGARPAEAAAKMAALVPEPQIRISGGDVYVKATVEEHERIAGMRAPPRPEPAPGAGDDVGHTRIDRLAVENIPVGAVLKRVASQLNLELEIDHAGLARAGASMNRQISIRAENVSIDKLLGELGEAAGLAIRREGRTIAVRPPGGGPAQ